MLRIVIADDHPLFREGLRKALSTAPDFRLVGEASDGESALELCGSEQPDVLVLDLTMPRCNGFGVLDRLPKLSPGTHAVVLTGRLEREFEERALRAGARGFLHKDSSVDRILKAIRAVAGGEVWASRRGFSRLLSSGPASVDPFESLTPREGEILDLLGRGMMNREIASKMTLSEKTVASHIAAVVGKLGVRGRVDAALMARRRRSD